MDAVANELVLSGRWEYEDNVTVSSTLSLDKTVAETGVTATYTFTYSNDIVNGDAIILSLLVGLVHVLRPFVKSLRFTSQTMIPYW